MFTEKPLKESKSFSRGDRFEKEASKKYHSNSNIIPLLVSPKLLRGKGMGQIDLASISFKEITIVEVKLNSMALQNIEWQKKRLVFAGGYLSQLFQKNVTLRFYSRTKEKLGNCFLS